jgi:ribonuclease HII
MDQCSEHSANYAIEETLWDEGFTRVMGLDEVGRGCLAGPVVAAGVIFKRGYTITGIRDSKKLTAGIREQLGEEIRSKALFWAVSESSVQEINSINILRASLLAMQRCTEISTARPDYLLVDGNRYTDSLVPFRCIVGGDDISASVAAASILAKVYRDALMKELHDRYPHYGWITNVGYPTDMHRSALRKYGFCEHHRTGFTLGTRKLYLNQ